MVNVVIINTWSGTWDEVALGHKPLPLSHLIDSISNKTKILDDFTWAVLVLFIFLSIENTFTA